MHKIWSVRVTIIWLVASTLAVLACSVNFSAVYFHGEYVPLGNDSFYHARRILDTAQDPGAFYEFDKQIHAPEGSLLNWPWGYDYLLGRIVRVGMQLGIASDPMAILVWIPVAAVPLALALLIVIGRRLGLSNWLLTLTGLCMALAPTTQLLHAVGQIDHHFAEMLFLLASLAAGLAWLQEPQSRWRAALLGAVLGAAPAIHNGLFVLQVPLLATLCVFWLQGRRLPSTTSGLFAAVLLAVTVAVLVPSLPFREGRFEFFTLSWFHMYVACCTAAVVALLNWLKPDRKGIALLALACAALLVPIFTQIDIAGTFLTGDNEFLAPIAEMQSPLRMARESGLYATTRVYSYLIYVAPLTAVLCIVRAWRERDRPRLLFWLTSVIGLVLLSLQVRLHYFGGFALYLPWFVVLEEFVSRHAQHGRKLLLGVSLAVLLLYSMSLRYQLLQPNYPALDASFPALRPVLKTLAEACAKEPGVVLADGNAGHYIRYYTACPVIVNNFLLTAQHFAKAQEVKRLFAASAADLPGLAPQVKYVLVRPLAVRRKPNGRLNYVFFYSGEPRLSNDLLLRPARTVPPEYRLLDEVRLSGPENGPYAKLYEIVRPPSPIDAAK